MIAGRAVSSVDAGRLAAAAAMSSGSSFHMRDPETPKGPVIDCGTLKASDTLASFLSKVAFERNLARVS